MPNKVAYTFLAVDKFSNVARKMANRTDELSSKMSEFRTEAAVASGAINRVVGGIRKAGFGLIGTGAALSAAQVPFLKQFAELEKIQVAFEMIVGSVEKGRKVFKDLQVFQKGTPFDLVAIKTAAQTLLTFGSGTEDLNIELTALGNIAAASGGRIEDLAFVFGKAQTAGRVTQDVINSLGIRGVDIMKVWSEKTGKSVDKIRKVVSSGRIPFEVLRETILDLGAREGGRFTGIMEEQAKRLAGAWTRFGSAMVIFKGIVGGIISEFGDIPGLLSFLERVVVKLTIAVVKFSKEHPFLTKVLVRLGTIFFVLGGLVLAFSVILQTLAFVALPLIIIRFLGFKAVVSGLMLLLPGLKLLLSGITFLFGALASASLVTIGALILIPTALFLIIRNFKEIKLFFGLLIEDLKELFRVVSAWVTKIADVIGKVTGLSKLAGFIFGDGDVDVNVNRELLSKGEVDLRNSGELRSRSSAVVDVNLNAPKGTIQSVKSRTTGDSDDLVLGVNMAEAF